MLDYEDILLKRYALNLSGREIAAMCGVSKSGVNDFLRAFESCDAIGYPLPEGITNYAIFEIVYGKAPGANSRDECHELPDYEKVAELKSTRQNMTLVYLWNRYRLRCDADGKLYYQYRQFCELYGRWVDEHEESGRFPAIKGEKMEVDFAGQTFELVDRVTGAITDIVVFVAVLSWSNYTYAEGMSSTKEPQWIEVNNNALAFFGGVPAVVVCDNCKQAVIANKDWVEPVLSKDYAEWAEHNGTAILPAKVRKPKWKSHVECAVGILEKGLFHDLEEMRFFTLEQFNEALWARLEELNAKPFEKKEHAREWYWGEERGSLMQLPPTTYHYTDKKILRVNGDYHVRYDNAYYSVDKAYVHKKVEVRATASTVRILTLGGEPIWEWPRATRKGEWKTEPRHVPEKYRDYADCVFDNFLFAGITT